MVSAYPARPAYPSAVIALLADLVHDTPRVVLDIGCGTGELARRLALLVDRVDAVDFSAGMLDLGRRLSGGDVPTVNWIVGTAEDVALNGPYALITAGKSLHWMDWDVVLPRFARVLTTRGVLAIVDRSWEGEPGLEILQAEIVQWLREARVGRRVLEGELAGFELARGHVRPGQSQLTHAIAIAHQGDQIRGAVLGQQHHL